MARLCALLNKAFTAPSSPVSGLAGYSLEGGAKQLHPASLAAVLRAKPKKNLTSLVPLVEKGDLPGHEFHGNQYTSAGGSPASLSADFKFAAESPELKNLAEQVRYVAAINPGTSLKEFVAAAVAHGHASNTAANRFRESRSFDVKNYGGSVDKEGRYIPPEAEKAQSPSMLKIKSDPYASFVEWFWEELARTIKASKKAKKTDLAALTKGDLPGHEFHGNQWTGGMGGGEKPKSAADLKSTEKSAMLKELLASGHPFSAGEIANITGASSTYVNKTLKAMEGKEHNGLILVKDGKNYQVKEMGVKAEAPKVEDAMTVGAKPGAVQETKPSEAKPLTSETHKAIPPASPMSKSEADKVYQQDLFNAHVELQQALELGKDPNAAVLQWKEAKALGMAQWKANTTGNGCQSKPQAVFASDLKFAEAMKSATTVAQMEKNYAQWKSDTAAEKAGLALGVKEAAKDEIGKMDAKLEPELPITHSSIVPASHQAITKTDFQKSTGAVNGKWARGMARIKSLLATNSDSSSGNKAQIEKTLGIRLKGAGNFQKISAMYDKLGHTTNSTKTLQAALISKWAGTSADSDSLAQAMQMAIRDTFGMDHSDVNEVGNAKLPSDSKGASALYSQAGKQLLGSGYDHSKHGATLEAALKDFVKAQYSNTQDYFAQAGIKELYLARGMKVGSSSHKGERVGLKLQPASSFSANLGTAKGFAHGHTIYLVKVPVSQVLGTYRTGYGCTNEHEVVILADKNTVAVKIGSSRAGGTLAGAAAQVAKDLS